MRLLIDGYNVIHARGWLPNREHGTLAPRQLERARRRLVNDLADRLPKPWLSLTTIVFDSNDEDLPRSLPKQRGDRGMTIIFAVDEASADERMIQMIGQHANPKTLIVVSSDNQIRVAAQRRRARVLTSDELALDLMTRSYQHLQVPTPEQVGDEQLEESRQAKLSDAEIAYWLEQFAELDQLQCRYAQANPLSSITPSIEELAEIVAEVDQEPVAQKRRLRQLKAKTRTTSSNPKSRTTPAKSKRLSTDPTISVRHQAVRDPKPARPQPSIHPDASIESARHADAFTKADLDRIAGELKAYFSDVTPL